MNAASHRPLLIIKLGSTMPALIGRHGDFEDWVVAGLRCEPGALTGRIGHAPPEVRVFNGRDAEAPLPAPATLAGVILTGSSAMVTARESWSERLKPWLRALVDQETPLLGICYGHQLLADAFGGTVGQRSAVEIGTVLIERTDAAAGDGLLGAQPAPFPAQTVHWQSVTRLPPDAKLLARSAGDPHHAFRIGSHAWGVQFHPEFTHTIMREYLQRMRKTLLREGQDADALLAQVQASTAATSLLARFAEIATRVGCGPSSLPSTAA